MSTKRPAIIMISIILCSAVLIGVSSSVSSQTIPQPAQLKIYLSPPSVPADNEAYNCVFIQLQDSKGNPARALQDTTISLSSSLAEIGTVAPSITIPKGATYGTANFYATFTPGATTLTAAATGYATVQAAVTTVGPKPYTIAVSGFPSTLPADGGSYEAIMVQLQDRDGSPARAPRGGTQVFLSCSDTSVGNVTPSVTIPEGQTYAIAAITTTSTSGQASVTALASDYGSTSTTITTLPQTSLTSGHLSISTGPTKVLADNTAYKQIAIQIIADNGNLGAASSDITVTIASADESIGKTETQITIPQSKTYTLATFNSTYKAGTTTITAAATNFETASQTITTTGFTASKLAVYCAPSILPSDKGAYQTARVQLQDSKGNPAQAPDTDLTVNLFSSHPTVGLVSPSVTIPLGKTYATGILTVTNAPGETEITAAATGYTTGQAPASTCKIDFPLLHVTVTGSPSSVPNGNTTEITAYVSAEGSPITGAAVTFTSNNGGKFTPTQEDPDQAGCYKTNFTAPSFSKTTTCTITADTSKTGFLTSQITTQITVTPPSAATADSTSTGSNVNGTGVLQLWVQDSGGNALSDAQVYSTVQPSGAKTLSGITNETGHVTFKNVVAGKYTFEVTKPGYQTLNQAIDFDGNPAATVLTLYSGTQGDNTLLMITAGIAVAVVIAVICIVIVKRRKPAKSIDPLNWPLKP
jgi:hypothetical protein